MMGAGSSLMDKIIQQAMQNSQAAAEGGRGGRGGGDGAGPSGSSSAFGGAGNVLGSEDTPSAPAAQPESSSSAGPSTGAQGAGGLTREDLLNYMSGGGNLPPGAFGGAGDDDDDDEEEEVQKRLLTFWRNGFSIEDGPLLPYDTPENKALLEAVHAGRAPPSHFGVRYDQPLEVRIAQRSQEDYQPPPKKPMRAFEGGGNRLGNVVPEVSSGSASPSMPGGFGAAGGAASSSSSGPSTTDGVGAKFEVDNNKPITSVQVRLGDGTRIVAKVNLDHTVADLRAFVRA